MIGLGLDAWWDEPDYKTCNTFHLCGLFILRKLREHDSTKFHDVMTDLYRDDQPDPQDIGTFEILQLSPFPLLLGRGVELPLVIGHLGW